RPAAAAESSASSAWLASTVVSSTSAAMLSTSSVWLIASADGETRAVERIAAVRDTLGMWAPRCFQAWVSLAGRRARCGGVAPGPGTVPWLGAVGGPSGHRDREPPSHATERD